uniref:NADH-ubiquinone oxidoreductase chain 4L n=1 Tax=Septifer bilocularis TaxID=102393 RepID=A0A516EZM0_9BIVA|nr:NADH dehydrogenase subunit 4L [Septifer bilocularis]QDO71950.1 NADH dehydrogenase subunit 4L [Septifer bilocularis]
MIICGVMVYFVGLGVVLRQKVHLIGVFVGLEFMSLGILFAAGLFLNNVVCLIFLVLCFAVCEASISLALIVMMVRLCGNDLVSNLVCDKS